MEKYKKVIHIIANLGNGGAERQLLELLKLNPSHQLLILKNADIYKKELEKYRINYMELNIDTKLKVFFSIHKISRYIASSKSFVVHAWMYNACLLVSLIKIFFNMKLKIVWGIRCSNMQLKYYSWTLNFIIFFCKLISFLANSIIYNSNAGQKYHTSLGFSNKFSKVIFNGIDEKKFFFSSIIRKNLRKALGIKNNSIVIVFAGRVDPMKNHINLLNAFKIIKKQNKKIILLLIGKGTETLKVQKGVISLGMQLNIEKYYSVGDIIVLPSKFGEGFSNVLAEGMLCKLFPVATNVGDSKDILSDIGLIIKDSSSKEIAKCLIDALDLKKQDLLKLKERSRERIKREFSIKKMSYLYNNTYRELF